MKYTVSLCITVLYIYIIVCVFYEYVSLSVIIMRLLVHLIYYTMRNKFNYYAEIQSIYKIVIACNLSQCATKLNRANNRIL